MDLLSLYVHLEISSYLSLNELVNCRLVSHAFKDWADVRLAHITHIELLLANEKRKLVTKESYIGNTFFSKPFVTALIEPRIDDWSINRTRTENDVVYISEYDQARDNALTSHDSSYWTHPKLYAFLGKFCPNLQVLRMESFILFEEYLALLGSKLQFFACKDFFLNSDCTGLLDQFPKLEGFKYSSMGSRWRGHDVEKTNSQLNFPICMIESDQVLNKNVDLLTRRGIKCLHFLTWRRPAFSLPQSLAETLVELSLTFFPTVEFCPLALPNLLYLTLNCPWEEWPAADLHGFVSTPRLRCLTCRESFRPGNMSSLMRFIHSLNELTVLSIDGYSDHAPEEKLMISLPSLKKLFLWTNAHFELVDHSLTSLEYLMVHNMASLSFVCSNIKVLVCHEIKLDPESLSQLLKSLSKCVKLAKLELELRKKSVPLQPLIDQLSNLTDLSHLDLTFFDYDSPHPPIPDTIHFRQREFASLCFLNIRLQKTEIVSHLTNSFTSFKFNRYSESELELKGPNKNYSLTGSSLKVLTDEELDKLVEVTLHYYPDSAGESDSDGESDSTEGTDLIEESLEQLEDANRRQSLDLSPRGGTETFTLWSWLSALVNQLVNLAEAKGTSFNVLLPRELKKIQLYSNLPLDSLCFSSPTIECLTISHFYALRLHLPNLRQVQFRDLLEPLDDTFVQLSGVTSMSFYFAYGPPIAVIKSYLKTASKLKQLTTLEFLVSYRKLYRPLGSVQIRQKEIPSVKKFTWNIPFIFEFYPEDKFTRFILRNNDFWFVFLNREQGYKYEFYSERSVIECKYAKKFLYTSSIRLPRGGLTQLSHLDFSRMDYSTSLKADLASPRGKFNMRIMAQFKRLTQVKHIQIPSYESWETYSMYRKAKRENGYKKLRDQMVPWLSSLTTLTKLQGCMNHLRLCQFLRRTQTAGPLQIVILKNPGSRNDVCLNKELHRTVNDLMRRKIISKFSHPAKCRCEADCLIKSQSALDGSVDI